MPGLLDENDNGETFAIFQVYAATLLKMYDFGMDTATIEGFLPNPYSIMGINQNYKLLTINSDSDRFRVFANNTFAVDDQGITVKIDGKEIQFGINPIIEESRTLVPMRALFEAMGATMNWDEATQKVTAFNDATTITLQIASTASTINGEVRTLDVPVKIVDDFTLVPLRFVAEAFGGTVFWDNSKTINLIRDSNTVATGTIMQGWGVPYQITAPEGWQQTTEKYFTPLGAYSGGASKWISVFFDSKATWSTQSLDDFIRISLKVYNQKDPAVFFVKEFTLDEAKQYLVQLEANTPYGQTHLETYLETEDNLIRISANSSANQFDENLIELVQITNSFKKAQN